MNLESTLNTAYRDGGISALAEALDSGINGVNAQRAVHAVTTNSSYVRVFGGGQIRFSDHTKFGMNRPTHIIVGNHYRLRTPSVLGDVIRRAVIAARQNLTTYGQVRAVLMAANRAAGRGEWSDEALVELAGF